MWGRQGLNRKHIYLAGALILIVAAVWGSVVLYEILQGQSAPDIFETESIAWNMTRPMGVDHVVYLDEHVLNSYLSDGVEIRLDVVIHDFTPRRSTEVSNVTVITQYEQLRLTVNASAILTEGFVHSIVIKFNSEQHNASLDIDEDPEHFTLCNSEIHEILDHMEESYITAEAVSKPKFCMVRDRVEWTFYDVNILNHQMLVTLEATYFNGTAYRRAVIPTQLAALSSP